MEGLRPLKVTHWKNSQIYTKFPYKRVPHKQCMVCFQGVEGEDEKGVEGDCKYIK
jgi:hypothetical protein